MGKYLMLIILNITICDKAHSQDVSIHLELVSLATSNFKMGCQSEGDFYIESLNFEFIVENKSKKNILIGSNTRDYYRGYEDLDYDGIIGKFLVVNGNDTIMLFTDPRILVLSREVNDASYWGAIRSDASSVFNNFLCRFPTEKISCLDEVYTYLSKCTFWYVPVMDDYEKLIKKKSLQPLNNQEITYPCEPIEIKVKEDLVLIFGDFENAPQSYGLYRGSKDSIVYKNSVAKYEITHAINEERIFNLNFNFDYYL
ncbi:hypothetical protein [Bacteroides sp. 519]|uniref:hypothetical protein n=1 Tax=Bacteroides sp. 519 TaxID=2302937 RepID=UPI0013D229DA|nr:hypothetical protein [Bacteroides sp. 519]